jgi:amphi-Trp domain-containing protein
MPEEILFESESVQSRSEIADYLRTVADSLEAGDEVTFSAGEQSTAVEPPERPTFEVKIEREGPAGSAGTLSVELEIEWDEGAGDEGDLSVE